MQNAACFALMQRFANAARYRANVKYSVTEPPREWY